MEVELFGFSFTPTTAARVRLLARTSVDDEYDTTFADSGPPLILPYDPSQPVPQPPRHEWPAATIKKRMGDCLVQPVSPPNTCITEKEWKKYCFFTSQEGNPNLQRLDEQHRLEELDSIREEDVRFLSGLIFALSTTADSWN